MNGDVDNNDTAEIAEQLELERSVSLAVLLCFLKTCM